VVVVAWLWIALGALAALRVGAAWSRHESPIDLTLLGVFAGRGLLLRRDGWRALAMIAAALGILAGFALVPLVLLLPSGVSVRWFDRPIDGVAGTLVAAAMAVSVLLVSLWQYRVLTRPEVDALFARRDPSAVVALRRDGAWALRWWLVVTIALVGLGYLAGAWTNRGATSGGWRSVTVSKQMIRDWRGNTGASDKQANSVGIVATRWPGWGQSISMGSDGIVVVIGETDDRYVVPMRPDTLTVVLPDGTAGQFSVPERFSEQMEADRGDPEARSLLRRAVELLQGKERERLEAFLSTHQEPDSIRAATSRPVTRAAR
jgi:hypothetical protein